MPTKSVIIIGAGIAGLAAGCYAQMNGYSSRIYEMHNLPGGLCTAWQRKGYTFDGCIHYLFGTAPGQPYHSLWQELGALQDRAIVNHRAFMHVVDASDTGKSSPPVVAYVDPDEWEAHLMAIAPEDASLIRPLIQGVRQFLHFDMSLMQAKPRSLSSPLELAQLGRRMLPFVGPLARWGSVSAQDYAKRFRSPVLRKTFPHLFGWEEIPMLAALSLLAYMHRGNAGFPVGGSLAFAQAIERRYLALGGEIHYRSQVHEILVEDDRAVGVRMYNNEEDRADYVISAADGRATIFDMLRGRYLNRAIRRRYSGQLPMHTQLQINLGIDGDLSGEPYWTTYLLDQAARVAGQEFPALGVKHYCFDPSLAPAGKSVLQVMLRTDYRYWQRIYGRRLYDMEQLQESGEVLAVLDRLYPGMRNRIEVQDVATPMTYQRFTGNWEGATCGWLLTKETLPLMIMGIEKQLPGLKNFYMAGQWVEPGGSVPLVAISGRNAVQLICHADGKPFVAEAAPVLVAA
jgi:phytoene dehydrogenase-like protein